MHRIVAGITDIAQHIEALSRTPERYRPQRCPQCGVSRVWAVFAGSGLAAAMMWLDQEISVP